MPQIPGWIGVDLDGTLAHYTTYQGPGHVGEPIYNMVNRVCNWLAAGHDVRIFTARVDPADPFAGIAREAIQAFCLTYLGQVLPVTNAKDRHMWELWGGPPGPGVPEHRHAGRREHAGVGVTDRLAIGALFGLIMGFMFGGMFMAGTLQARCVAGEPWVITAAVYRCVAE